MYGAPRLRLVNILIIVGKELQNCNDLFIYIIKSFTKKCGNITNVTVMF